MSREGQSRVGVAGGESRNRAAWSRDVGMKRTRGAAGALEMRHGRPADLVELPIPKVGQLREDIEPQVEQGVEGKQPHIQ